MRNRTTSSSVFAPRHRRRPGRSQLLARISAVLGSTLDVQATLTSVATLAVPEFADWCAIHMTAADGSIQPMTVHHTDQRKAVLARRLLERHPPSLDSRHGIGRVLRTGRSELYDELPWQALASAASGDPHLRLLRRIRVRSAILVPMVARDRTLGVITFAFSEADRRYTPADLAIAEQLGAGAALAIENAALFAEAAKGRADAQAAAAALRQSNEELERFAYVSSHDLKEPLRTITSYAQLFSKRYRSRLDPDADEFIDYMVEASLWMNTLIDAVLSYSRLTRTEAQPPQPVDSEAALAVAVTNLRKVVEESGIEITHDPLPSVMGDRIQMIQVFQNLLSNAIKYRNGSQPKVHVSATRDGEQLRLSVSDNGIGIPEQYWNRVFDLFLRLHSRPTSGAGIGLATCRKIVELQGGRIWLESKVGVGTTVYFTLSPAPASLDSACL